MLSTHTLLRISVEHGSLVFLHDFFNFRRYLFQTFTPSSHAPSSSSLPYASSYTPLLVLQINIATRPSAAQALMHPYFRSTFVERLQEEGEVVEQDRKLEAVRDLLHRVRMENR